MRHAEHSVLRSWLGVVLFAWSAAICPEAGAQIVDRMVAIVDGDVVTQGDIDEYRALATFFGEPVPGDDDVVLRQIIENRLIEKQIARFPANAVRDADVDRYLSGFGDPGGIPEGVLRAGARGRIELERYYASLRRLMRATDAEIEALYQNEFVPAVRARGEAPPPLSEVKADLGEVVIAGKLDREISVRVETLYRQYDVEVVD